LQAVAAIMVSVMIFRAAATVLGLAAAPLLDAALPRAETEAIDQILHSDPQVQGYHALRTRRSGSTRLIDVHVLLPDDLTFVEAHRHAEDLEEKITAAFPGATDVIIHAEPFLEETRHQQEAHRAEAEALDPITAGRARSRRWANRTAAYSGRDRWNSSE
jgi:divalent metal cation (Fe/Co/Zn/Cd) transporter